MSEFNIKKKILFLSFKEWIHKNKKNIKKNKWINIKE